MQLSQRLPRLHRASEIRNIQLTPRDVELMRLAYKHRFVRSTHAIALLGGSAQGVLRRLQLLFHHGYLDRRFCEREVRSWGGGEPLVYSLGSKGAEILQSLAATLPKRLTWLSRRP